MSTCFTAYRHVNGISLNPREYILDENNDVFKFKTKVQIFEKLNVKSEEELEEQGIYIDEEPLYSSAVDSDTVIIQKSRI